MRAVIAGSYRKFYQEMLRDVIPVLERAGVEVAHPRKSRIINPSDDFPLFEGDNVNAGDFGDPAAPIYFASSFKDNMSFFYSLQLFNEKFEDKLARYPFDERRVLIAAKVRGKSVGEVKREISLENAFLRDATASDFVYVYNPDGYIGEHTFDELAYFLHPPIPNVAMYADSFVPDAYIYARHPDLPNMMVYALEPLRFDGADKRQTWVYDMNRELETRGGFYTPMEVAGICVARQAIR